MAIKALIVEDEPDLAELVRYHLEKEGVSCVKSSDGVGAIRLARTQHPDFLILDLLLPELDGLEVCRQLRRDPATARLPIIMLTAKAEETDRIVGLELGADDYIVKPFSPRELVARMKAVLRRAQPVEPQTLKRIGGLEVDENKRFITVHGRPVDLTVKEFDLLCVLIRVNGRVLNREQILEAVWGYANAAEIESRTVDVHVRRLRGKLGREADRIITIKGVGYRFDAEDMVKRESA